MKLHIVARGKVGPGAEAELIARYSGRVTWPFQISELPDSGGKPLPPAMKPSRTIALDETGEALSSAELAALLSDWRDAGVREARFLIGGADGLSPGERESANRCLSFGRLTWPHRLARAMLAEQLYRATSIVACHPYHREG